jgi:hypothetical protein
MVSYPSDKRGRATRRRPRVVYGRDGEGRVAVNANTRFLFRLASPLGGLCLYARRAAGNIMLIGNATLWAAGATNVIAGAV